MTPYNANPMGGQESEGGKESHKYIEIYKIVSHKGVNEAHRIPGLTGSGIRTTKAKETVNNLKNSRCLEFIGTGPGQERGEETWLMDFGIVL